MCLDRHSLYLACVEDSRGVPGCKAVPLWLIDGILLDTLGTTNLSVWIDDCVVLCMLYLTLRLHPFLFTDIVLVRIFSRDYVVSKSCTGRQCGLE